MKTDKELRELALSGDRKALEELISRHQDFIYNVVWKMVLNPADAEDITQDVLIKVVTNLARFKGDSALRTWIYRIAFNHVLNLQRRPMEQAITTFEAYGEQLDSLPDSIFPADDQPNPEEKMVIDDVMFGCTAGMLLCLDREQRMVYILGEIFGADSETGAEILEISKDNFRQRLSRARKQLYQFMEGKCGLVNKKNPCRCRNKTKAFVDAGWVNPANLQFNPSHLYRVKEKALERCEEMDDELSRQYKEVFVEQPFVEKPQLKERLKNTLAAKNLRHLFDLN